MKGVEIVVTGLYFAACVVIAGVSARRAHAGSSSYWAADRGVFQQRADARRANAASAPEPLDRSADRRFAIPEVRAQRDVRLGHHQLSMSTSYLTSDPSTPWRFDG